MKTTLKRVLAMLLCLMLAFSLAACGSSSGKEEKTDAPKTQTDTPSSSSSGGAQSGQSGKTDTPSAPSGSGTVSARDTLNVCAIGDKGTLLPHGMTGSGLFGAARMYCEPLWEYTADEQLMPILAESVEGLNSTTWTVHLRKGIKFSNGSDFTAEDVIFSMQYYKDATKGQFKEFDLEQSKILDDYTIEFILNPFGYTMCYAIGNLLIYDKETFDENEMITNPIGTGPYKVKEYVIGSYLYLEARDDYWGEPAKIKNLNFYVYNEDSQITNAIQNGELDYVSEVPAQDADFLETIPDYTAEKYYTMQAPNLSFNLSKQSVMSNLDARLACCYALNRNAVIDRVYFGNAEIIRWPVSEHSIGFEESMANLHPVYTEGRNVEKAKDYAEKAGLVGKEITVITNGGSNFIAIAEIFQANMKEIGVTVTIKNYDAASYMTMANTPDAYDIAINQSSSSAGLALSLLSGTMMFYPTRFEEWEDYDFFYNTGMSAFTNPDPEARQQILRDIIPCFIEDAVWFGICDVQATRLIKSDLAGMIYLKTISINRYDQWYWVA